MICEFLSLEFSVHSGKEEYPESFSNEKFMYILCLVRYTEGQSIGRKRKGLTSLRILRVSWFTKELISLKQTQ